MSQFATSSWGGRRKLPYAFTEHGSQAALLIRLVERYPDTVARLAQI